MDSDIEDRCFTIAGFFSPPVPALYLDLDWKATLQKWDLDYFKSSEIELGFGQFAKHRDDPNDLTKPLSLREKNLIREIKTAFVDVICKHCSDDGMRGVGATLVLRDFYLFCKQEPDLAKRLPPAYDLCGSLMLLEAGLSMTDSNELSGADGQGEMQPIFDEHEEYGARFKRDFPLFAKKNPRASRFLKPPRFEDDQKYLCLQAADLLAYESRKLLIKTLYEKERPERKAMTRLKEHVDRLYFLDYESLKLIAEAQSTDEIAIEPKINNHKRRL